MSTPKFFLAVALAVGLSLVGAISSADENRRDGNWWHTQQNMSKLNYLIGFLDGMDLGANFSVWGIMNKDIQDPAIGKAVGSYSSYLEQYTTHVTVGQINAGLDDFYRDYKNLSIKTSDAVWVVLKGISGAPKDQIESLVENLRKKATRD
jgi:hypothetical protein